MRVALAKSRSCVKFLPAQSPLIRPGTAQATDRLCAKGRCRAAAQFRHAPAGVESPPPSAPRVACLPTSQVPGVQPRKLHTAPAFRGFMQSAYRIGRAALCNVRAISLRHHLRSFPTPAPTNMPVAETSTTATISLNSANAATPARSICARESVSRS